MTTPPLFVFVLVNLPQVDTDRWFDSPNRDFTCPQPLQQRVVHGVFRSRRSANQRAQELGLVTGTFQVFRNTLTF